MRQSLQVCRRNLGQRDMPVNRADICGDNAEIGIVASFT